MISKKILVFSLIIIAGFSSCYYDNFAELNPGVGLAGCTDTAGTITFATKVLPIMQQNCGTNNSACHQDNSSTGYYNLNSIGDAIAANTDGKLLPSINHTSGASAMPKNGGKMDACSIAVIQKWINTGAN